MTEVNQCKTWHKYHDDKWYPIGINSIEFWNSGDVTQVISWNVLALVIDTDLLKTHSLEISSNTTGVSLLQSDWFNKWKYCVLPQWPQNSAFIPSNRKIFTDAWWATFAIWTGSDKVKNCIIFSQEVTEEDKNKGCEIFSKDTQNILIPNTLWNNNLINIYLWGSLEESGYQSYINNDSTIYTIEYTKHK